MTQQLYLKDIFNGNIERFAARVGTDSSSVRFIRKGITSQEFKVNDSERTVVSYITTASKDRDGEIILPSGADLAEYRRHPVVLFGHDYSELPVGKNLWIKADAKGLIAKTQYANHAKAQLIYEYRKDGFPLAQSIGFVPVSYIKAGVNGFSDVTLKEVGLTREATEGVSIIYDKWILLEYSDVPVPSNADALQISLGRSMDELRMNAAIPDELKMSTHEETHTLLENESTMKDTKTDDYINPDEVASEEESTQEEEEQSQDESKRIDAIEEAIKSLIVTVAELSKQVEELMPDEEAADEEAVDEEAVADGQDMEKSVSDEFFELDDSIEAYAQSGDGVEDAVKETITVVMEMVRAGMLKDFDSKQCVSDAIKKLSGQAS